LYVVQCPELSNIAAIGELDSLETLYLDEICTDELIGLRRLRRLRTLYLPDWRDIDFTPLTGMRGLTVHIPGTSQAYGADLLGPGSSVVGTL
jgi:hypothetical protein